MTHIVALSLRLAILGACLSIFVDSFVNPSGKRHAIMYPRASSVITGSSASKQLVMRFLSEQSNDDDEKKPSIPPPTPPISDVPSDKEEAEFKTDSSPPSDETVEAERPRVPMPAPAPASPPPLPKPVTPPKQEQQQKQIKKPTQPARSLTRDEEKLALASGVGGLVVGAIFGVLIDLENPNIDLTMSPTLPPVFGAVLVSTLGYVFGGSAGGLGKVVRTTLGGPTVVIGNFFTSIIEAIINNAVTSAKNKVKEATDDIKSMPGKIADEIKATPGRVADAAVETATEIAEEIKATPGKVADAAVETATEIADEIKATPGRVVKQTKQAVEDAVDDTLDAVEDFVDDVKAIPQKAIDGVESALGVSKLSTPRPPLAPPTSGNKTPLPPKDLPGSLSKVGGKKSFIPNISSLKIPETPKLSVPKISIPKSPSSTQKAKAATEEKTPINYNFPSETQPIKTEPKFELPKFDIPKASKPAVTKKSPSAKKKAEAPKFGLPKIDVSKPKKPAALTKKIQPKKIAYSFPSEAPPSKTEASKFELPRFGTSPSQKATSSKPDTRAVDAALKKEKQAEANRLRQEAANKKRIEADEKVEKTKRQKQEEADRRAAKAVAAEGRRIEEQRQQEKKESQRIEAAEKAKSIKRQKQLEARQKAGKVAEEAAERKRIQEQKKQEKVELQRLVAEKRREEAEEKKKQVDRQREKQALKAKELQEEKEAAAQRAQRKQVAEKSLGQAKSRTTISLGNLFGGNAAEVENEVKVDNITSKPKAAVPQGVPVVSNWEQNADGSISGRISGSPNFSNGQYITTSPVPQGATSNSVVKTSSGSRYFLEQEQQAKGFSFGFGMQKARKETEVDLPPKEEIPSPAAAFAAKRKAAAEAKRLAAEEKKVAAAALAEERKAIIEANRKAIENKKAAAAASTEEKRVKAAAVAESKRQAAEEKRGKAAAVAEQRRAAAEEKKERAAAVAEQRRAAAEEKKEKAAAVAEQRRAAAEAKKQAAESRKAVEQNKKASSVKTAGFFQGKRSTLEAPTAPSVELPPKGVPVIKSWKERSDGGVSGRIYGSPNFEDGDFIETSPISKGKIENGSVVATKSKSRYYLSAATAVKKSNIMAAFKDLAGAKPGATITLTSERKEREAKAAIQAIEKAKPRSTFSLFGLGLGDLDKGLPPKKEPTKSAPKKNARKKASSPKVKVAPKGVPTVSRWNVNRDGSITGIISGSINFNEGEQVTTSMISNGRIESGEVVTTGSGSRYFLA